MSGDRNKEQDVFCSRHFETDDDQMMRGEKCRRKTNEDGNLMRLRTVWIQTKTWSPVRSAGSWNELQIVWMVHNFFMFWSVRNFLRGRRCFLETGILKSGARRQTSDQQLTWAESDLRGVCSHTLTHNLSAAAAPPGRKRLNNQMWLAVNTWPSDPALR